MYDTTELLRRIDTYWKRCRDTHKRPTYQGIAEALQISPKTVANVDHGAFNGKPYTERPHPNRCVGNDDFEIIQGLFRAEGAEGVTPTRDIINNKNERGLLNE